jgi:hypothetical protein
MNHRDWIQVFSQSRANGGQIGCKGENHMVYSSRFVEAVDVENPDAAMHVRLTAEGEQMLAIEFYLDDIRTQAERRRTWKRRAQCLAIWAGLLLWLASIGW